MPRSAGNKCAASYRFDTEFSPNLAQLQRALFTFDTCGGLSMSSPRKGYGAAGCYCFNGKADLGAKKSFKVAILQRDKSVWDREEIIELSLLRAATPRYRQVVFPAMRQTPARPSAWRSDSPGPRRILIQQSNSTGTRSRSLLPQAWVRAHEQAA